MNQPTQHLLAVADFNASRLDEDERARCHRYTVRDFEGEPCPSCGRSATGFGSPLDGGAVRITHESDGYLDGCDITAEQADAFLYDGLTEEAKRARREIEAQRTLLANWRSLIERIDAEREPSKRERLALTRHGLDQFAYQMASVHGRHPDYKPEWRP